jgi:hypothetical protein
MNKKNKKLCRPNSVHFLENKAARCAGCGQNMFGTATFPKEEHVRKSKSNQGEE